MSSSRRLNTKVHLAVDAHDVIAGIGLINLLWHGLDSKESVPIDYRIYDKDTDGKTKNTHFCDMLKLAKDRGIEPEAVVMDAWYSSLDNALMVGFGSQH